MHRATITERDSDLIDLTFDVYHDFGFDKVLVAVSTRPEQRVGSDEQWDRAEQALSTAVENKQLEWKLQSGEGAFYGPKIEFVLCDSIGRTWQCGTIQVDFFMPDSLGASYIAEDGTKRVPVMIHRAVLGSIERFIGILIEHYAGAFPVWLAPTQVVVLSLTEKQADVAMQISDHLKQLGFRAEVDLRNETIGFKIREHTMQHVAYQLIVGAREAKNGTVSVRARNGEELGDMKLDFFVERLRRDVKHFGRILEELTNRHY